MADREQIASVQNCASGSGETGDIGPSGGGTNKHVNDEPSIIIDFPLRLEFQPGTTLAQAEEVASLLNRHLRHIRSIRHAGQASSDLWDVGPRDASRVAVWDPSPEPIQVTGDLQSSFKIKQLEMLCREKDEKIAALIEQRRDQTRLMEKLVLLLPAESLKDAVPLRTRGASILPPNLVQTLLKAGWLRRLAQRPVP